MFHRDLKRFVSNIVLKGNFTKYESEYIFSYKNKIS